jgi:uncharacterized membrane protein
MDRLNLRLSRHRVDALADGVFAIVVTLIVLELHVPELPRNASAAAQLEALGHLAFPLFSFVITFALAGAFWYLHQLLMHFVERVDRGLVWLNLAFLLFVSLLPFSTTLLGRFHLRAVVPQTLYFLNQFGIATMLWLQWRYARRNGLAAGDDDAFRILGLRIGALAAGAFLAAAAATFAPMFAFYGFLIPVIAVRVREKRRAATLQA